MYVYGDEYFEVSFPIDHFLRLTGVETMLSARDCYKNAKKGIITNNQFTTNLEFTLGLTENIDSSGNKINEFFLPMSLRVEDTSVEKSRDGEVVDFIFSKDASVQRYNILLVGDKSKIIPDSIKHLISDSFYT